MASLPGYISDTELYFESVVTLPNNGSTPCCAENAGPSTTGGPGGSTPGNVLGEDPFEVLQPFIAACVGGGTVPTAADLTDSESWA